jgi:hypothetical protein
MANYDFVMPYKSEMEAWLRKNGYPHPKVNPLNRLPIRQEIFDAIASVGWLAVEDDDSEEFFAVPKENPARSYEIRIGEGSESITMHGHFKTELLIVEILSHRCGQLLLYPDTGSPAVIVQPGIDIEVTDRLWREAEQRRDSWEYFFARMYS